jgi:predicted RNA-binding protein with PIN domain
MRLWHTIHMPYWFDGNNLIGQSAAAAKADSEARREFLSALTTYHRCGGGKFLVYFDGDNQDRTACPPGVSIRYSAPLSADKAILRRLREMRNASEIIVVTNDRQLMLQCRNEGAAVLSSSDFIQKMQSRRFLRSDQVDRQEPVNVDDWMRYFGFESDKKPVARNEKKRK